jgi:hypothetical protein
MTCIERNFFKILKKQQNEYRFKILRNNIINQSKLKLINLG